jgi:hypothetical protein
MPRPLDSTQKRPRYSPPQGPNPPGGNVPRLPSQGSLPSPVGGRNGSPAIRQVPATLATGSNNTSGVPFMGVSQIDKNGMAPPRPALQHTGPRVTRDEVDHHMEVGSRYV